MTDREYKVERARLEVRNGESKVREAEANLTEGYKKAQAELEREYIRLKEEVARARNQLEIDKAWLKSCEVELQRGFEV